MKIQLHYVKEKKEWHAGIYRGKGVISSLIIASDGNFFGVLKIFKPKYIWRGLTWK